MKTTEHDAPPTLSQLRGIWYVRDGAENVISAHHVEFDARRAYEDAVRRFHFFERLAGR